MAFGIKFGTVDVSIEDLGQKLRVRIVHDDGVAPAFGQWREIGTFDHRGAVLAVVEEMMWNLALSRRGAGPAAAPAGWSIHPVAAAIIAATGHPLPNPSDPASWLATADGEIHLLNGGRVAGAVLVGQQGILLLRSASIVDASGDVLGYVRTEAATPRLTVCGSFPHTLASALVGRRADAVCELLVADPRGAGAIISAAEVYDHRPGRLEVDFHDRLVPLLPGVAGGERWRPRRARGIVQPRGLGDRDLSRWLGHRSRKMLPYTTHTMRAAYARAAQRVGSCLAAPTCAPTTGTP